MIAAANPHYLTGHLAIRAALGKVNAVNAKDCIVVGGILEVVIAVTGKVHSGRDIDIFAISAPYSIVTQPLTVAAVLITLAPRR
jgi:hypothetical protein